MRNFILSAMSAGLLFASTPATQADAAVRASINLNFGTPPQVYFARPPRPILIPDTQVYYVEGTDYDMFQCDGMWYVDNGGYWFEAPSYRGPFESISFEDVPQEVIGIPTAYAHQPYRPGMWRVDSRSYGYGGSYGQGWNNRSWQGYDNRGSQGYNRGWQGYNNRGWQGYNNRGWQGYNNNRGWQQPQRDDQRTWRNSDQRWQDRQSWQQNSQGDQGHGNHGRGHGNGHGRGQDNHRGDDD